MTIDLSVPETREFWKAVFLTVLAHPDNTGTPAWSPTDYAMESADKAVKALLLRVNGDG